MRRYQFQIVYLDRLELRNNGAALEQLKELHAATHAALTALERTKK